MPDVTTRPAVSASVSAASCPNCDQPIGGHDYKQLEACSAVLAAAARRPGDHPVGERERYRRRRVDALGRAILAPRTAYGRYHPIQEHLAAIEAIYLLDVAPTVRRAAGTT